MAEQNHSQTKQRPRLLLPGGFLLLLVVVSVAVLGGRFGAFRASAAQTTIDLLATGAGETDLAAVGGQVTSGDAPTAATALIGSAEAGLVVSDEQQVWITDTEVDIFKITYQNGENRVTVAGTNGNRLLAPGTTNSYSFQLNNTGDTALDYTLTAEAYFGTEDAPIPVEVKFSDHTGRFFAGSETGWSPVLALNDVTDSAVLSAKHYARYTLTWQWPFEGDDAYDTFLGNLATEQDVTLTIVLHTTASTDIDEQAIGGIPQTGDTADLLLWSVLAVASLALVLLLLLAKPRDREEKNDAIGKKT